MLQICEIFVYVNKRHKKMKNKCNCKCNDYKFNETKEHWFNQFKSEFLEVMNLGMDLRQNQLNGYCDKSGNEILNEWFDDKCKKF